MHIRPRQSRVRASAIGLGLMLAVVQGVPRVDVYSPCSDLLVFAAAIVDTGDGVMAATPNWVFVATPEGRLDSALDGHPVGTLDTARGRIVSEH